MGLLAIWKSMHWDFKEIVYRWRVSRLRSLHVAWEYQFRPKKTNTIICLNLLCSYLQNNPPQREITSNALNQIALAQTPTNINTPSFHQVDIIRSEHTAGGASFC